MFKAGKGPTGRRMQRIQKIHIQIKESEDDVDLTKLLATCEYQMGITRERGRIYLATLEDLGFIEVDEVLGIVRAIKAEE